MRPRQPPPLYEDAIIRDLKQVRHGMTLKVGDPRLGAATKLQRLLLVRVVPVTAKMATIELTDAGRTALKEHQTP